MLIGAMNSPVENVMTELAWMHEMGLEFVDLTIEPPSARDVDPKAIRKAIENYGMQVVGHTAFYLPFASPFEEIRKAAVGELRRCLEIFHEAGVRWMNLHPDRTAPMHTRAYCIGRNLLTLGELLPLAERYGMGLMIENLPGEFNTPDQLGALLDPLPDVGLHLDIGHANLLTAQNMTEAILARFGSRLRHVHLHDNKGGAADLHMPLGSGTVDYKGAVRLLKACRYDGTITLEVFTPDKYYLKHSRDLLRAAWDS